MNKRQDTNTVPKEKRDSFVEAPKVDVFDVAAYILQKSEPLAAMKLQRLIYYSQAWSLVWDKKPIFTEPIKAWLSGPVVGGIFDFYRGRYELDAIPKGDPESLTEEQRETVDAVLEYYGHRSLGWLTELGNMEDPWKNARKGLGFLETGDVTIRLEDMADYYRSLLIEADIPLPGYPASHKIATAPPSFLQQKKAEAEALERLRETFGIAGDKELMPIDELHASMIRNGIRPEDNEFSRSIIEEREK